MSQLFFLLVIALLPIQLSKFFFVDYSYVLGLPIDYRAITLYLSDIATVLFLMAAIFENRRNFSLIVAKYKFYCLALFAFNFYLIITTIFFALSPASYYFNFKVLLLSLFSLFAANLLATQKKWHSGKVILAISVFWQSLLILAQFALQHSVGLRVLGERTFDASTVQIAHSQLFGQQFLRPYGSFPHPNVAAAFLAFSIIILAGSLKGKLTPTKITGPILAFMAILVTFSKSAFIVLAVALASTVKSLSNFIILSAISLVTVLFIIMRITDYQIATVAERLLLSQAALDIALINPAFGIGSNNFILELARLDLFSLSETRLLQPVHNVFLLILAENGIVGLMLFAALLITVARSINSRTKVAIFFALLFYLSIDHFLWTLHQGQLIFWLILAYISSPIKGDNIKEK